jgi:GDPmannose 4,6-dehydratase
MTTKTALVTGVSGQDGSYLTELLLEKKYKVIGLYRRSSTNTLGRISHLLDHPNLSLEEFDLTDPTGVNAVVSKYQPHELYNLAAQSHVGTSFKQPTTTFEINAVGVINLLEAIKNNSPSTRFYQASTSEMFGFNYSVGIDHNKYQDENTAMLPQSPYGIAKLAAHNMVRIYRSGYGVHASCGILFNHESPRRGENFVTRKITRYIGRVLRGETTEKLKLGNLSAKRDWGHAKDYVRAMWLMLQQTTPDDYVIATGVTWSVQEFLDTAFSLANLNPTDYVEIDPDLFRPAEVDYLMGSPAKARDFLGWTPEITFPQLVKDMLDYDVKKL